MASKWIEERRQRAVDRELNSTELADEQRAALRKVDSRNSLRGVSVATRACYLKVARQLALFLGKPFEQATREDIAAFLEQAAKTHGPMSMVVTKSMVKNILTYLTDAEGERVPESVSWLRMKLPRSATKLPQDLLTLEEVKRMAEACRTPRDRAVIMVLYDSACRISEVCGLRVGDCVFDQYGLRVTVHGKTGSRRVRLISSVPDLQQWLDHHPRRDEPDVPLFVDHDGERPLMQDGVTRLIHRVARKAGIKKHVHAHLFRHSRLTQLAKQLSESELKIFAGWTAASTMARVYIHLSGDDVDRKLLQSSGLVQQEQIPKPSPLEARSCSRCQHKNPSAAKYCQKCTLPLDEPTLKKLMFEQNTLMDSLPKLLQLLEDPEVASLVRRKAAFQWKR